MNGTDLIGESQSAALGRGVLRINGSVVDATEFAYDGCHKIFLIFNPADREAMLEKNYLGSDIFPVSRLPEVWESTCMLRFISRADLTEVLVEQADPDPTITYSWEPLSGWRGVTGLTAEQTATMEEHERFFLGHHEDAEAVLIEQAEYMAACNRIDADYAHVAVPAGATTDSQGWVRDPDGEWSRSLEWAQVTTSVEAVDLYLDGRQNLDGSHTSQVSLYSDGAHLSAEQARALAAALVQAADELDRLNGGAR